MGCCASDNYTRQIEQKLRFYEAESDTTKKVLLLGSADSGKSTIFKHIGWLYGCNDKDKYVIEEDRSELN